MQLHDVILLPVAVAGGRTREQMLVDADARLVVASAVVLPDRRSAAACELPTYTHLYTPIHFLVTTDQLGRQVQQACTVAVEAAAWQQRQRVVVLLEAVEAVCAFCRQECVLGRQLQRLVELAYTSRHDPFQSSGVCE